LPSPYRIVESIGVTRPFFFLAFISLLAPDSAPSPPPQTDQLDGIDRLITDGKYAEAEKGARLALLRAEADAGPASAAAAHAINRLAEALLRQGRTDDETARLIARAVDIETRVEPSTRELATAVRNDAWLFEARGYREK